MFEACLSAGTADGIYPEWDRIYFDTRGSLPSYSGAILTTFISPFPLF
jgi:hypothetical protein